MFMWCAIDVAGLPVKAMQSLEEQNGPVAHHAQYDPLILSFPWSSIQDSNSLSVFPLFLKVPVQTPICCMLACGLHEPGTPGRQAGAERDLDGERLMETKT